MNLREPDKAISGSPPRFVDRCREIGLVPWRLDVNGMPVSDPDAPSGLRIWLCGAPIRRRLVECAEHWSTQDKPERVTIGDGIVVFPFGVEHRSRRVGYTVMLGILPEAADDEVLLGEVNEDRLAKIAVQHGIRQIARPWLSWGAELDTVLRWMHDDAVEHIRDQDLLESYTGQLTDSFETITAMHMLGREMGQVEDPHAFLSLSMEMIGATLDYEWSGCLITTRTNDGETILIQHGDKRFDAVQIAAKIDSCRDVEPIAVCDGSAVYPADGIFRGLGAQFMFHPLATRERRFGWIIVSGKRGDDQCVSSHDTKTLDSIAGIVASFVENWTLYEEQRATFLGTVRALSGAIDAKDRYTQGHSQRVAMLGEQLTLALGHDEDRAARVRLCGILHDIGKIGIPESVLCKDGRLTDEEFDLIRAHPATGARMLEGIPSLADILPGVLHHHERWDGKGYPGGISGEEIPEIARILALADTFDAMSSNRAYRSARPREEVLAEIRRCAGSQFDPSMVEAFVSLDFGPFDDAVRGHAAQSAYKRDAA